MDIATIVLISIGAGAAGLLSGWVGLGGMSIFMPLLFWLAAHGGWGPEAGVPLLVWIIANSMSVMGLNSAVAVVNYRRDVLKTDSNARVLDLEILQMTVSWAGLAAIVGMMTAIGTNAIGSADLWFGLYLLGVGCYNVWLHFFPPVEREACPKKLALAGIVGGGIAGFVGFNGNSMFIPLLRYLGFCSKHAIATAQCLGIVIAFLLTVLFVFYGILNHMNIFNFELMMVLTVPSCLASIGGAALKKKCDPKTVNLAQALAYLIFGINLAAELSKSLLTI